MKVKIEIDSVLLEYELNPIEGEILRPIIITALPNDIIKVIEPTAYIDKSPEYSMQVIKYAFVHIDQGIGVRIISEVKIL